MTLPKNSKPSRRWRSDPSSRRYPVPCGQRSGELLEAVQGAASYEEAMGRLLALYPAMEVEQLEDVLAPRCSSC